MEGRGVGKKFMTSGRGVGFRLRGRIKVRSSLPLPLLLVLKLAFGLLCYIDWFVEVWSCHCSCNILTLASPPEVNSTPECLCSSDWGMES